MYKHDSTLVQSTYKDLDKLAENNKLDLSGIENMSPEDAEKHIFDEVEKLGKQLWTKDHKSNQFGAAVDGFDYKKAGVMPLQDLTDIYKFDK
jgi:hypothetical protein